MPKQTQKILIRKTGTQFVHKVIVDTSLTKTKFTVTEKIEPEIPVVIEQTECSMGFDPKTSYCYNLITGEEHESYVFCDYVE